MREVLAEADSRRESVILDGFPRNIAQAELLEDLAASVNTSVARVISIDVPHETIIDRLGGRRSCPKCGANYHLRTLPPKQEGICDRCGTTLILRSDDDPETIRRRLIVYERETQPLIAYYEAHGKLSHLDGSGDAATIANTVLQLLATTPG